LLPPPKAQPPGTAQAKGPTTQQKSGEWQRIAHINETVSAQLPTDGVNLSGAKDRWGVADVPLRLFFVQE